ncbi:hypothetical protein [Endozoicomonas ascidiicola]|uniref:hypothetical protein n=1 Tax=Endozoicomonas ascidiicola TaxID=1698521 RepID=UPI000AA73C45|nr:hypothetical protein [Endozoicomonas ascidiicola]
MKLISILVILFISLFVVVKLTEKHGKPMTAEQQSKLSRIAMVLIFVMIVAGLIKSCS